MKLHARGGEYEGETSISLNVVNTDLILRINTQSGDVSLKTDLTLDASTSRDPEGG